MGQFLKDEAHNSTEEQIRLNQKAARSGNDPHFHSPRGSPIYFVAV